MRFFDDLGKRVHQAWHARNFDERVFHEVAEAELRSRPPSEHVTADEIVEWVHESAELPPQGNLGNTFGDPPLVVYTAERFYVEALFWVDSTTDVHQHSFSGAFHVMEGSSLHAEYEFRPEHRYSDRLSIGRLDLASVEHLHKGDVRVIRAGDRLIHSLFHLDRPSVSVVVRTREDPLAGPQYAYQRNGIAVDGFYKTASCARKLQTLGLLHTLGRPTLDRARRTIEAADPLTAYHLLTWVSDTASDADYARLLVELRSPHRALVERMTEQRDEAARNRDLTERRKRVRSLEHRFFLAMLLNVPSRARMFEIIEAAYPGAAPARTVLRWVSELAETKLDDGSNALDVELTPSSLRILAHLIDGASDQQVIGRLREEYEDVDDQVDDVREHCRAFRTSRLFRPLFQSGDDSFG